MVIVLALVALVIYFIFKMMRKSIEPGQEEDPFLRKVSSITLSTGKTVQIVTLLDKAYVLGVSENGVSLIEKIDDLELINAMNVYTDKTTEVSKPKSFQEMLEVFSGSRNAVQENKSNVNTKKNFFSFFKKNPKPQIKDEETQKILDALKNKRLHGEE